MINFLNLHLTKKQKIRLYKICLILDDIDFGYLRPVTLGTLLACLIYIGSGYVPYYQLINPVQTALFIFLLLFVTVAFIYYLIPYIRKLRAKIRVRMNRRKKRATFTPFASFRQPMIYR